MISKCDVLALSQKRVGGPPGEYSPLAKS